MITNTKKFPAEKSDELGKAKRICLPGTFRTGQKRKEHVPGGFRPQSEILVFTKICSSGGFRPLSELLVLQQQRHFCLEGSALNRSFFLKEKVCFSIGFAFNRSFLFKNGKFWFV